MNVRSSALEEVRQLACKLTCSVSSSILQVNGVIYRAKKMAGRKLAATVRTSG